ncbi:MAG TPA: 2OG-Fe(II) oxygenase [Caulobacteraceae bacterium]|nr:2OG-Fe(II) oxygenase [Caulobacteraceae bacterium]
MTAANLVTARRPSQGRLLAAGVRVFDDVLPPDEQKILLAFLKGPGWSFGAFSDNSPGASRYWYKHFAGIVRDGREALTPEAFEAALAAEAPVVASLWTRLSAGVMAGHKLTRCYANGYPQGSEGGLHFDSNVATHFTAIYYPHLSWHPNFAGETVFFDGDGPEIVASVYPRPNRLVLFPGTVPHVARGVSRSCPELRITLMFKTTT